MPAVVIDQSNASQLGITSGLGNSLLSIMMADDIQVGSQPSYELCKLIYLYHPLGQKMAEAPIKMAQSQQRKITVQDAPNEVVEAFEKEWQKIGATEIIKNHTALSRVYGVASLVMGCKTIPSSKPLPMEELHRLEIFFNVLDPLNTAGSLVLSQIPTAADFMKPVIVRVYDQVYHRSRYQVMMNESPVYLAYSGSAFGFVGRSVYQRALFPLKSFIRTMIADDMIATKLGLLIAKQKPPGSVIDRIMQLVAMVKRNLLKIAQTNQVLSIDVDEEIETLDMTNVEGAGKYSRENILKNTATSADMPAFFLENETMVEGFGEGTEDAKNIARYINGLRLTMQPTYAWFDNIVQYRAWNPQFYEYIQAKYPEEYGGREYMDAFSEWRGSFKAAWPSLLIEPESEQVKVAKEKLSAMLELLELLLQQLHPEGKVKLLQWAADTFNSEKVLFPHELEIDWEGVLDFAEEQQTRLEEHEDKAAEGAAKGPMAGGPGGKPGGLNGAGKGLTAKPQIGKSPAGAPRPKGPPGAQ